MIGFSESVSMGVSDGGVVGSSDDGGMLLQVQIVGVWKGHEPEGDPRWDIGGQRALNQRRWCSEVGMGVLKRVVILVH